MLLVALFVVAFDAGIVFAGDVVVGEKKTLRVRGEDIVVVVDKAGPRRLKVKNVDIAVVGVPRSTTCPIGMLDVTGLCVDIHEVTAAAYGACIARKACPPLPADAQDAAGCTINLDDPLAPMNCTVTSAAEAFCKDAGKRLPTEHEWQRFATGGTSRKHPWGDEAATPQHLKMHGGDSFEGFASVGSFPKGHSPEGLWDLAGNVAELTRRKDGTYAARGGGHVAFREGLHDATTSIEERDATHPWYRFPTIGFRCVASPLRNQGTSIPSTLPNNP